MPSKTVKISRKAARPAKGKRALNIEDHQIETAADMFTIISTKAHLQAGLSIVRPMGDGKFELVSLDKVAQSTMGSEEAAELVQSVPERKAAMKISEEQWNSAKLKCDAILRATGKEIFRFFKLPVELRFKIYKLVVFNPDGLRFKTWAQSMITPSNGFGLMLSSRQCFEECSQFYFLNNFLLEHKQIVKLRTLPELVKKLQEVQFIWEIKYTDARSFSDLGTYPNLRVLNLSINYSWLRHWEQGGLEMASFNRLFQDEESLERFCKLPGFDDLVSIRGLQRVTFKFNMRDDLAPPAEVQEYNVKAFEDFLNKELTQQRAVPKRKVSLPRVSKAKPKI